VNRFSKILSYIEGAFKKPINQEAPKLGDKPLNSTPIKIFR